MLNSMFKKKNHILLMHDLKPFQSSHLLSFIIQSVAPQKGGEVNLTLGGIDLNNSGRLACFFVHNCTCPDSLV